MQNSSKSGVVLPQYKLYGYVPLLRSWFQCTGGTRPPNISQNTPPGLTPTSSPGSSWLSIWRRLKTNSVQFLGYSISHDVTSLVKKGHSASPGRVVLRLPSPSPRVCKDGRTYARWRQNQKFFGSTGYQFCLPMVLRELRYQKENAMKLGNVNTWYQ